MLDRLAVVRTSKHELAASSTVAVPRAGDAQWEAEAGRVISQMRIDHDDRAFGARFVWAPGAPGERGAAAGHVSWRLNVAEEGVYYLWARVQAPTPSDDSFFVRAFAASSEPVSTTEWHTGTHAEWEWAPVGFHGATAPAGLSLPAGELTLQFRVREDGTKLDRLFLTRDPLRMP